TVGELVATTVAATLSRRRVPARASGALRLRSRIVSGGARGGAVFERNDVLTPYALDALAEDARHAGPGARIEITLDPDAPPWAVASVREALGPLAGRGVTVAFGHDAAVRASALRGS